MQNSGRWVATLLAVVIALQIWTLMRQANLDEQVQRLSMNQSNQTIELRNALSGVHRSLSDMAEAERWVVVHRHNLESTTCETATARVEWELRQWTPGTVSRLLYRTAPDQPWQEATTESLGGQNYAATFAAPGKPVLMTGMVVSYDQGKNGHSVNHESMSGDKSDFDRDYHYQIVAEGPNLSQSTGVRSLPLGGEFIVPAKIMVDVEKDGRYRLHLFSEQAGRSPCTRIDSAELRAFASGQAASSIPLQAEAGREWRAEWKSEQPLHRLELVLRFGGEEKVVEIPLNQ